MSPMTSNNLRNALPRERNIFRQSNVVKVVYIARGVQPCNPVIRRHRWSHQTSKVQYLEKGKFSDSQTWWKLFTWLHPSCHVNVYQVWLSNNVTFPNLSKILRFETLLKYFRYLPDIPFPKYGIASVWYMTPAISMCAQCFVVTNSYTVNKALDFLKLF